MNHGWNVDPDAEFTGRLGKPAWETPIDHNDPGSGPTSTGTDGCPDLIEMTNHDVFIVARTAPAPVLGRLPEDVKVRHDEVCGVIPAAMFEAAARDYLARLDQGRTNA